jgi:hypothetical protein
MRLCLFVCTRVCVRARVCVRLCVCVCALCMCVHCVARAHQWYPRAQLLFVSGIRNSDQAPEVATRIKNLNSFVTYLMYKAVCRSLFERHKLLFSFIMTVKILQGAGAVDPVLWRFLISGVSPKAVAAPNPDPGWITSQARRAGLF